MFAKSSRLTPDGVARTCLEQGIFNHHYKGFSINGRRPARSVYYYPRHDGDDGAGQISKNAGSADELKELVSANMKDLGFDAKFKVVENGRLEFVGLHAAVKNGIVRSDVPIIPMVNRSLSKIGKNAQAGGRDEHELRAIDATRLVAIGEMFSGKVPAITKQFHACAEKAMHKPMKDNIDAVT